MKPSLCCWTWRLTLLCISHTVLTLPAQDHPRHMHTHAHARTRTHRHLFHVSVLCGAVSFVTAETDPFHSLQSGICVEERVSKLDEGSKEGT